MLVRESLDDRDLYNQDRSYSDMEQARKMFPEDPNANDDRELYFRDKDDLAPNIPKDIDKINSLYLLKPKTQKELQLIVDNMPAQDLLTKGIRDGNIQLVKYAIEKKGAKFHAHISSRDSSDIINFFNAIRRENTEILKYILSKLPNLPDGEFLSPGLIYAAVETGNSEIVKIILKDKHINPWADKRGSFLSEAIKKLDFDIIDIILKDGRVSPLGYEARNEYEKYSPIGAIDWMLRQHEKGLHNEKWQKYRLTKDQINKLQEIREKLFEIAKKNQKRGIKFEKGIVYYRNSKGNIVKRRDYILFESKIFKPKSTEEIKNSLKDYTPYELIQMGMNKNMEEPILWALERGVQFHEPATYQKLFLWAINKNSSNVLKKLLDLYEFKEQNFLHALEKTDYETSKVILDHGIKPTNEILNQAILQNDLDKVKLLLQYPELDPSAENNIALSFALYNKKDKDIVKLLINDPRVKATLEPSTLEILHKNYNSPVKENLYI